MVAWRPRGRLTRANVTSVCASRRIEDCPTGARSAPDSRFEGRLGDRKALSDGTQFVHRQDNPPGWPALFREEIGSARLLLISVQHDERPVQNANGSGAFNQRCPGESLRGP